MATREVTSTFKAYLAGLFDSRGHISCDGKTGRLKIRVSVPIMHLITLGKSIYGGSIYRGKFGHGSNWCWELGAKEGQLRFCRDLQPFSAQGKSLSYALMYLQGRYAPGPEFLRRVLYDYYREHWYTYNIYEQNEENS